MIYLFVNHRVFYDLAIQFQHILTKHYDSSLIKIVSNFKPNDTENNQSLFIIFGLNTYEGVMPRN